MAVYKDLDLSFENTIYKDFPVLEDKASIVNTFRNNLFIDPDEKYFDSDNFISLKSVLHSTFDASDQEFIEECIISAVNKDPRIDKLLNLDYEYEPNNYELTINITLRLNIIVNQNGDKDINFNIIVNRE